MIQKSRLRLVVVGLLTISATGTAFVVPHFLGRQRCSFRDRGLSGGVGGSWQRRLVPAMQEVQRWVLDGKEGQGLLRSLEVNSNQAS